ncbi:MAG: 16S rRNA (cytidine(1402)-2'-O)-methyltransferase [Chloroflexi bacterium]|nr:16S rRNA (cytidine(1402)-2'-O)-methyltransferase [Chloroflexota bacterium]
MSNLYLVATPIGNLEDLTFRAERILKEVPLIAAEDTRTTSKLLKHYQIDTPLTSYHDHNKTGKTDILLGHLIEADLALVSDAGTPAINDPGYYLVRAAIKAGHLVIPIPGASAPLAALSASGLPTDNFLYLGYLPRKTKARQDALEEVKDLPWTLVYLETPHRLLQSLEDCKVVLGDRQIVVARELTKMHEEIYRGTISEARDHYTAKTPKGEITLVISGKLSKIIWPESQLMSVIKKAIQEGEISPSQLAKSLVKESGWSRRDIYDLMHFSCARDEASIS